MENMIDITGADLVKFVQRVYELSVPQGLGFLHFTPEPLSEEEAKSLIQGEPDYPGGCIVDMDYVKGRACKMNVWKKEGRLYIAEPWYDHTNYQLQQLLESVGIKRPIVPIKHGVACNCVGCRARRRR